MKKYEIIVECTYVEGYQTFACLAENEQIARQMFRDGECEIIDENLEVIGLDSHINTIEESDDISSRLSSDVICGLEQRIIDLERQLKTEREINDRLRVVETERAARNDELYEALGETVGALYSSYDATEWPADGTSHQEVTALKGEATLEKHSQDYGERPLKYIAVHPNNITSPLYDSKSEARKFNHYPWEIIPIRVSGDCDDSH